MSPISLKKYPKGQYPNFTLVTKIAGKPLHNRHEP
ncbi:hypothetical protein B6N60_04930 [Richelia sinica FACHB-800]|uniref:Uncharacterized protein n=1 Tax=Richelia sinica FACHB-800 TaxID=1357546 RepID=A0A975TCR4_9NOST|nr:hypothetical protein B6N60_04930 [Richelia sinica FACHB-800]